MRLPPFPENPPVPEPAPTANLPEQYVAPDPNTLVVIARGDREELGNLAILLAALDIRYVLRRRSGVLMAPAKDVERALFEWRLYAEENAEWPEPPPAEPTAHADTPATILLMGLLALFYAHTGPWREASPWFAQGAVDAAAVMRDGEWWRLVTALTLHADFGHLIGNVLVGGVVIHLLCRRTGYGLGWLLLILTAALANWCNVAFRGGAPHHSVGFSTAVFAAIGLLSGMRRYHGRWALVRRLTPIGAGIGLLAMLGAEGPRTDLGAHLFGFACGLALGLFWRLARIDAIPSGPLRTPAAQRRAFLIAAALVVLAWHLALAPR